MLQKRESEVALNNRLLHCVSGQTGRVLQACGTFVSFKPGETIYHADDRIDQCYFPTSGMVSLLSVNSDGKMIEAGYSGYEGIVGAPVLFKKYQMPYQAIAQSEVPCFAISAAQIARSFDEDVLFRTASLYFGHVLFKQFVQTCVCNHFHSVEARACRWLSILAERSSTKNVLLTQEFLAMILGVRRASISDVNATLRNAGLIQYKRSSIEIINLPALRERACECYEIIHAEYSMLQQNLQELCSLK